MITVSNNVYNLTTENTSYAFKVDANGHLEHLYYGSKILNMDSASTCVKKENVALEDIRLEFSTFGKGDIRDPFLEITHADGGMTSDFLFKSAVIGKGKPEFKTLPGSFGSEDDIDNLVLTLYDASYDLTLVLSYFVFHKADVITRSAKLINTSDETVTIDRLLSTQIDLQGCDFSVTSFHGNWAREMDKHTIPVTAGKFVNSSYTGTTSSRSNPFIILSKPGITERTGECYGFNLVYSGNHYSAVEADSHDHTHVVMGINPQSFGWKLCKGDEFEAPEAVFAYSSEGFEGLSHIMHNFILNHIVRGEWAKKERPIVLNSWEAAYFDINEEKLVKLAKAGAEAGMELFVMDDGWFGERNDDTTSLGDWDVNLKKLPGGLKSLVDKVNEAGMRFGIWVEPEMISVESKLYEAHPDWDMSIPGKPHTEGRTQRILDLANPEIVEYITDKMTEIFSSANIEYVKWDMNRNITDLYSRYLPADRQKEAGHRYVLGFYQMAKTLNERFPSILFEGCSSGGNRFDLGMLCYFPQIWASDDTDALRRLDIQTGYSYGYPTFAPTTHVSASPNHQTMRRAPLSTRFNVALLGNLGYELNLCELSEGELDQVRFQVEFYKKYRKAMQLGGKFYRDIKDNFVQWTTVSEDKKYAFSVVIQLHGQPNPYPTIVRIPGLEASATYKLRSEGDFYDTLDLDPSLKEKLDPDHPIFKVEKEAVLIPSRVEEYEMSGEAFTNAGFLLKENIAENVWSDPVSYYPDFVSKLYVLERVD